MRGKDEQQLDVFSYVSPEQRVPQDHPLRPLRAMTDEALRDLQPRFNKLYAKTGRPSIAPEKLLRALLLQALCSVRSERLLMEQLDCNLLFRWFVGLNMDDAIWDVTPVEQMLLVRVLDPDHGYVLGAGPIDGLRYVLDDARGIPCFTHHTDLDVNDQ